MTSYASFDGKFGNNENCEKFTEVGYLELKSHLDKSKWLFTIYYSSLFIVCC